MDGPQGLEPRRLPTVCWLGDLRAREGPVKRILVGRVLAAGPQGNGSPDSTRGRKRDSGRGSRPSRDPDARWSALAVGCPAVRATAWTVANVIDRTRAFSMPSRHSKLFRFVALPLVSLVSCVQIEGCASKSLVWGGVGDPARQHAAALRHFRLQAILPGTLVTIILRDSTRRSGQYVGIVREAPDSYARRFEEVRSTQPDSTRLPALGAKILIRKRGGREEPAILRGFGFRKIEAVVRDAKRPEQMAFESIETVQDLEGRRWERQTLFEALATGALPVFDSFELEPDIGPRSVQVPLDRIAFLTHRSSRDRDVRMLVGVIVGIAAGVAVVVIVVDKAMRDAQTQCASTAAAYSPHAEMLEALASQEVPADLTGYAAATEATAGERVPTPAPRATEAAEAPTGKGSLTTWRSRR